MLGLTHPRQLAIPLDPFGSQVYMYLGTGRESCEVQNLSQKIFQSGARKSVSDMRRGQIASLPESVAGRIGSDQTIPSIAHAVEELACNALDAGATEVHITLDMTSRSISSRDNGEGIDAASIGLVGRRHVTSKLRSLEELHHGLRTFGFRGEALHALALVSHLEVISCAANPPNSPTFCTVLKLGSRVFTGPSREARAPGCTVNARHLFANRAVERKRLLRASAAQAEVEASRQRLVRLAVANPGTAFRLHDAARGNTLLESPRTSRALFAFRRLMGVAPELLLAPLSHEEGALRLSGHIAPPPHAHHTRELQLVCVNRRPLGRRCELHRLLEAAHERLRAKVEYSRSAHFARPFCHTRHTPCFPLGARPLDFRGGLFSGGPIRRQSCWREHRRWRGGSSCCCGDSEPRCLHALPRVPSHCVRRDGGA